MKAIKRIVITTIVFFLVDINISVLKEAEKPVRVLSITEASTGSGYCYDLQWTIKFIGTGFGCSESTKWCYDIR